MKKDMHIVTFIAVLSSIFLCNSLSSFTYADNQYNVTGSPATVSVNAAVTVSSACSLSSHLDSPHVADVGGGIYQENIGQTTIKTFCNDANGYALYAIGYTGDSYTGTNHTKLVGATSGTNISTGTYTQGTTTDSVWSMKLAAVSGTYAPTITSPYTSFSIVPDNFAKVASYNQSTDAEGGTGSSITTTYAAYVSGAQVSDTYTGKVKYVLVHPNTFTAGQYTIAYNANGGSGSMTSSTGIYNFEPFTLPESTFAPPNGYGFAGWCTSNASQHACTSGTLYQPGDEVTSLGSANSTTTLYAIWGNPTMQEFAANNQCAGMSIGSTITIKDARDDQDYTVAKLADGKCWMTSNLNLAGGTALSADDTDVDASYISSFTTGGNLTKNGDTIVLPTSSQSGFDTNNYSYIYNSPSTDCSSATGCYSYYSWDAATLGSGRSISTDNTDAPYSICPKGWRLPTTRTTSATNWQTTSDFYVLAHQYGLDSTTSASESDNGFYTLAGPGTTPNFLLAGRYGNNSFYNGGLNGFYWSVTSHSSTSSARGLFFYPNNVNSAYENFRYYGFSVRCLVEPYYMQDLDSSALASMMPNTGDTAILYDSRDNSPYLVGKLVDGNYWMLDNLALDLTDSTVLNAMDDTNTNASATTLGYLKGTTTGTTSDKYATSAVANWTSDYSFSDPLVATSGTIDNETWTKDTVVTHYGAGSGKIGIFYNFCAATAGSYCYGNGHDDGISSGNATEDICPAGWRMPTGYYTGEFYALWRNYNYNSEVPVDPNDPDNLPYVFSASLSGSFAEYGIAELYQLNDHGGWWSTARYNDTNMYRLYIGTSYIQPYYYVNRDTGCSLRCIKN